MLLQLSPGFTVYVEPTQVCVGDDVTVTPEELALQNQQRSHICSRNTSHCTEYRRTWSGDTIVYDRV